MSSQTPGEGAVEDRGFRIKPILSVSFGHLVQDSYASFLAPFLPLIIDKFGLTMTLAGLLSVLLRVPSVLNPFIGALADRCNLRFLFIFAPVLTGICMSFLGLMPHYGLLCVLLIVAGLNSSVYHVVGPSLIAGESSGRVGRGMGFWMTSGELARTLGPLLAVAVIAWLGFESSYPVAIIGMAASVYLFVQFRNMDTTGGRTDPYSTWQVWKKIRHVMRPLLVLLVSRGLVLPILITYLPTFLVSEGMGAGRAGLWLVVLEVIGTAGTFAGGTLSDRLGRRGVLLLGMGISPLAMLLFVHADGWLRILLLVVLGMSVFVSSPVLLAVLQDHARQYRSTATGFYMASVFGIAGIALLVVGWLVDMVGFNAALSISAVVSLLGLPALFFLPEADKSRQTGQ